MDYSHIDIILRQQVRINGTYQVDEDGVVNVQGDVLYDSSISKLGVQFGTISGNIDSPYKIKPKAKRLTKLAGFPRKVMGYVSVSNSKIKDLSHAPNQVGGTFYASGCPNLTSLHGAPRWVGKDFIVHECNLTSLQGAPLTVNGVFDASYNPLENYDHLPEGCKEVILPYLPHAPVLKLLMYPKIHLKYRDMLNILIGNVHPINEILNKYAGQGKAGAIKCAAELVKAGYKENARW